ncbi:hypothetical protein D3C74_419950 [compost metagenome]
MASRQVYVVCSLQTIIAAEFLAKKSDLPYAVDCRLKKRCAVAPIRKHLIF